MQYIKITELVKEQIQSGQLAAGSKLPSERKLAELFKTTRVTLREALSVLESEGLIFREGRRGWFVSQRPLRVPIMQFTDFDTFVKQQGKTPSTCLIQAENMLANTEISKLLSLAPFSDVYHFSRVHNVDGRPVMYAEHTIRADRVPNLIQHPLEENMPMLYYSQWQLQFTKTLFNLESTTFEKDIANFTRVSPGTLALKVTRINIDELGVAQELVREYWRHNAVVFEAGFEITR